MNLPSNCDKNISIVVVNIFFLVIKRGGNDHSLQILTILNNTKTILGDVTAAISALFRRVTTQQGR